MASALPWRDRLGHLRCCGVVYQLIVLRRMTRQTSYTGIRGRAFHFVVPIAAYATLAILGTLCHGHAWRTVRRR